jgi:hypothetical protein
VWNGLTWLRTGTSDELLRILLWDFVLHRMQGISQIAEELLASEEGLCSMELFRRTFWAIIFHVGWESATTICYLPTIFMFFKSAMEGLSNFGLFTHYYFYGWAVPGGPGPVRCRYFTIALRHTTLCRIPLARRRDLYLTTHNNPKGIRTRNRSHREATNPRLRRRRHQNRRLHIVRS